MNFKYFFKCIYGKFLGLKIQFNMKILIISFICKFIIIYLFEYQGKIFDIFNLKILINCIIYFDSYNIVVCFYRLYKI